MCSVSGAELNSFLSEEDGCCVQFLQCSECNESSTGIVGVQVKLTEESCRHKPGQVGFTLFVLLTVWWTDCGQHMPTEFQPRFESLVAMWCCYSVVVVGVD